MHEIMYCEDNELVETYREVTEHVIKKILASQTGQDGMDRELTRTEHQDAYKGVGSIMYSLNGTPPKGYALYVPGHEDIYFYDSRGNRFGELWGVPEVKQ